MADKFQTLFPVAASFAKGESPTPSKFEGVFTQIDSAFDVLELALGDMWHTSQDGSSPLDPLYIANLSRAMGDMSLINPAIFSGTVNNEVEIVAKDVKLFALTYAPQTPSAVIFNDGTVFQTYVASRSLVIASGDYYIDAVGRVYTFLSTHASNDTQATYDYVTVSDSSASATFNVIPDPHDIDQTAACTAGTPDGSGFQIVTLPVITDVNHPNYGDQISLPQILSGMTTGAQIPSGFIKVWDNTNEVMVDSVVFYKEAGLNTIKVKVTPALDTAADRYSLVTVGTSISGTLQFLRDLVYSHTHTDNVTPFIHHDQLLGIDETITHGTNSAIVGKDDALTLTNKEHFRPVVQDDDPTPVGDVLINVIDGEVHFYDKNDYATQASEIGFKTPRLLHLDSIPSPLTGKSADMVDNLHAYPYTTPTAEQLLALDTTAKVPLNAIHTGHGNSLDADMVDGIHASTTATANTLLALNVSSKLPASITGDADTVDGQHASAFEPAFSKNTAFNKNFGSAADTVAEGNHGHGGTFGAWGLKSFDTIYQATTDGFVVAYGTAGWQGTIRMIGYTDSSNPPTTARVADQGNASYVGSASGGILMPVRKNDYYQIELISGTGESVYWLPAASS